MRLDFPDFSGRHIDQIEAFCLFVEQLEEAVQLLRSGRLAGKRMALVALDNLAEMLLHDFTEQVFLVSDETAWLPGPRFSQEKRRKLSMDFHRKVSLASRPNADSGMYPQPLLDELDASIFRVAHRYRNDVYHAGRHNRALIGPLGQLYGQAVGRAFIRSHREGQMMGGGIEGRLRELDRFDGWRDGRGKDTFVPLEAAIRIVKQICAFTELVPSDLAGELGEDIEERCSALAEDLDGLRTDGLSAEAIESLLKSVQLWAAHRGDEELIRLQQEQSKLILADDAEFKDATFEAVRALESAERERRASLERDFSFPLKIENVEVIRKAGRRLRDRTAIPSIVLRYHELDESLDQLEAAVDWMLVEWDRYVQSEVDRLRGK